MTRTTRTSHRSRWGLAATAGLLGLLAGPAARAEIVHYSEPHPIAPGVHKGMCYIEGPHVHAYKPHKPVLYVQIGGHWSFVGDPVEFEAEAPKYTYYGHHPVFWIDPVSGEAPPEEYCYISGPHHHWYEPPPELAFKAKGGVYWYVGGHPRWYRARWRKRRHIDRYYASVHIAQPTVVVEPPEGFIGVVVGPGGRSRVYGHVDAEVYAPPPPHMRVHVGGPSVNIRLPGAGVFFGPGPAPRGVRVHHGRRVKYRGGPPRHAPAWGRRGHRGGGGKGRRKWK